MSQTMCIVGILYAYMAYKIILYKFNQRKKNSTSAFIWNYNFFKGKK